jgi:CRISPR-associated endonuclease Cas2
MRRKTKEKVKTISSAFLELLGTGAFVTIVGLASQGRGMDRLSKYFVKYGKWRIRQLLRRLRLQELIVYDEQDENSPIFLTENGLARLAKERLRTVRRRKWDHLWRLILFDIPERKKARQNFQKFLRSIGCYQVQKSVYVHPHECKDEVLRQAAQYSVSSNVMVYTVPNLGPHEKSARIFFLHQGQVR